MKTAHGDFADRTGRYGTGARDGPRRADRPRRLTLLALAAVFILPFLIGSSLFWSGWRPAALRNHGELIQPPRALPESAAALHGKWLLIVPARSGCGPACQETLQRLLRVHAALGKERNRVQRVLVSGEAHPIPLEGESVLAAPSPALTIIPSDDAAWRRALGGYAPAVFIADPLGNVVMRYGEPIDARSVLRDMERLLKYSWVR